MTTPEFDPERSAAIRAGLATTVEQPGRMPVAGWRALAAVALAGVLVGGAVTAAVAANLPRPDEMVSASGELPVLPDGLLPGAPIVSLVGEPTTTLVSAPTQQGLIPPRTATHVRVTVTCLTAGTTYWGFDAGGNNPSSSCAEGELADSWMDFPLNDAALNTLFVTPDAGVEVIVTTQFLVSVGTEWGINAAGQTYGVAKPVLGDPDLIAAYGVDGTPGYVDAAALARVGATVPPLDEVRAHTAGVEGQSGTDLQFDSGGGTLPLYESDGATVVGEFRVG